MSESWRQEPEEAVEASWKEKYDAAITSLVLATKELTRLRAIEKAAIEAVKTHTTMMNGYSIACGCQLCKVVKG